MYITETFPPQISMDAFGIYTRDQLVIMGDFVHMNLLSARDSPGPSWQAMSLFIFSNSTSDFEMEREFFKLVISKSVWY